MAYDSSYFLMFLVFTSGMLLSIKWNGCWESTVDIHGEQVKFVYVDGNNDGKNGSADRPLLAVYQPLISFLFLF